MVAAYDLSERKIPLQALPDLRINLLLELALFVFSILVIDGVFRGHDQILSHSCFIPEFRADDSIRPYPSRCRSHCNFFRLAGVGKDAPGKYSLALK